MLEWLKVYMICTLAHGKSTLLKEWTSTGWVQLHNQQNNTTSLYNSYKKKLNYSVIIPIQYRYWQLRRWGISKQRLWSFTFFSPFYIVSYVMQLSSWIFYPTTKDNWLFDMLLESLLRSRLEFNPCCPHYSNKEWNFSRWQVDLCTKCHISTIVS